MRFLPCEPISGGAGTYPGLFRERPIDIAGEFRGYPWRVEPIKTRCCSAFSQPNNRMSVISMAYRLAPFHSPSTLQSECCSYITLIMNELPHSLALSVASVLQIYIIGFDCALVGLLDLGFGHVLSAELGVSLGDLGIMPEWHPSFAAGREGRSRAAELIHSGVLLSDPVAGRSGVKALRVLFASLAPRAMPDFLPLGDAQRGGCFLCPLIRPHVISYNSLLHHANCIFI